MDHGNPKVKAEIDLWMSGQNYLYIYHRFLIQRKIASVFYWKEICKHRFLGYSG
jgi:hypothetical protein